MKILVIDRDTLSTQLIRARLETMGHTVVEEAVKNNALERLEKEAFDAVLFDPAPLNNARPIILGIRRACRNYPYLVLLSHDMSQPDALKAGANDLLIKPLDVSNLDVMMKNAKRLTSLIAQLGDETEDFPSAGGVIAKSAFNQLFLSGIDRADRYAERSFLLFIRLDNREDLLAREGPYAAEYTTAKLSQYLVRLRRQSDIIAQTGKSEYCLMLQRPVYETEPKEAANRFAEALGRLEDIRSSKDSDVKVAVRLIDIPVATLHAEHIIDYGKKSAQTVGS
jgi:DNA-binding response OmpR family regulator